MHWNTYDHSASLDALLTASHQRPQLIFKHSTRCGISAAVLNSVDGRFEDLSQVYDLHLLDLLQYREKSNELSEKFAIRHESPQVIILRDGQAALHLNHWRISPERLLDAAQSPD